MSTASTTWGTSRLVGAAPVWPPPSAPVAITASTPHAATFSACRRAPAEAMVITPASRSVAISSGFGASANEATGTCSLMITSMRAAASAASARRLTPNGALVRPLSFFITERSSLGVIVAEAMIPSPPAWEVAAASRAPETYPIPAWITGQPIPSSSVSGVRITGRPRSPEFLLTPGRGVELVPDEGQFAGAGPPGEGHLVRHGQREAGGRQDVADRDAVVDRAQPHGPGRRTEIQHRQVGDHHPQLVETVAGRAEGGGPVVADAAGHVDALDEDAAGVPGEPVTDRVVDAVAGGRRARRATGPSGAPSPRCRRCSGCRTGPAGWPPSSRAGAPPPPS